eukprot:2989950-Prorocentrum_lima.AAC.1
MAISRCPMLLMQSIDENLKPSISFLQDFLGGDDDCVRDVVRATSGRILLHSIETAIKPKLAFLKQRLSARGPQNSTEPDANVLSGTPHKDADSLVRWLVRRCPSLLTRS